MNNKELATFSSIHPMRIIDKKKDYTQTEKNRYNRQVVDKSTDRYGSYDVIKKNWANSREFDLTTNVLAPVVELGACAAGVGHFIMTGNIETLAGMLVTAGSAVLVTLDGILIPACISAEKNDNFRPCPIAKKIVHGAIVLAKDAGNAIVYTLALPARLCGKAVLNGKITKERKINDYMQRHPGSFLDLQQAIYEDDKKRIQELKTLIKAEKLINKKDLRIEKRVNKQFNKFENRVNELEEKLQ